jgi:hypothetical protein
VTNVARATIIPNRQLPTLNTPSQLSSPFLLFITGGRRGLLRDTWPRLATVSGPSFCGPGEPGARPFCASRFLRRGPRRITGQRYCYNLCESRVGSATLIAAARGYAFSCRTERSLQGGGGLRACRFDNPTSAAQEGGAYGGRRQSRWRPLRPAALLSAISFLCWPSLRAAE